MGAVLIELTKVTKIYRAPHRDDVVALKDVSLRIFENEFVCVVGPSGCGKTTMLNIIAGLEPYDLGSVCMNGHEIVGPGPDRGVIFQQYALFPWLTVRQNIEYGMKYKKVRGISNTSGDHLQTTALPEKLRKLTKEEKRLFSDKYIRMVNLQGFENTFPKALSGGMKQRVAIARAYALAPDILLMDEPFGALDAQTRAQLQEDLLITWQNERKTCLFITHDVEEAVLLSSKIIIMSARPGEIMDIIDVGLPYPRNQATKLLPEFVALKNRIWDKVYEMYLEVRK